MSRLLFMTHLSYSEENITPPDQSAWQEESVGPRRNKKATNNTRRDPPSLEDIGPATKRPRFADRIKEEVCAMDDRNPYISYVFSSPKHEIILLQPLQLRVGALDY